ncbi:lytic transglycosylase domain-containing protein [Tropicibacter sp. Alg240-R139]|uniref:lytic transglycosylase domain-containing protein n=1 Tax=Tropicibacter sp. Alg240-R139 TaxID=2305991 RepID=UPI0013DF7C27|nr:lytic transglycosylase domain-containing protein [Tropicibacter sp. Alg240-R139]
MNLRIILLGVSALFLAIPGVGVAQSPTPFPEFQAKRLKAPPKGSRPKITVQIDPTQQVRPTKAKPVGETPDSQATPDAPGTYAWFWDKVSPDLNKSGPGRLEEAMHTLAATGGVSVPRLQFMQDIAKERGIPILRSTVGTDVSPALVLAVIAVESAGKSDAVSGAGAQGLMQLMPATAARFGVSDSLEPDENIAGGVKYLDWLMGEFGHDPIMVLAGYNAGEGSVKQHQGVPPYPETRDYVPKVLAAFQVARGLCATPPQLISDGCVFTGMN